MEDRKLRRQINTEVKKERKPINKLNLITKIIVVLFAVITVALLATVIYLNVLPLKFLIPICILAVVANVASIFFTFRNKTKNKVKVIISAIAAILIVVFSFVELKLIKTVGFLNAMSTETVNSKTYSVVVLSDSEYTKIEDIQYKLLLYYDNELEKNKPAIDKLTEAITIVTEKTDDVHELASKLIDKDVDAILVEDSYYPIIEEEMADFRTKTKVIYTFALEDTIEALAKEVSVTKEPFNIYVSGIDAYGKISSVARSDVNMVISVNPQTKQVLLVNIPRDYYVKLNGTSGYRDKLTHAGIYGIDMSVKTIEDLFNIDINYYVRVNFTSLIKIIDAIGGVNVYSKYSFTSRIGKYKFVEGYNQMNGKQALGFARERYSFAEGDRMRGQNQQAVIDAMIKKVCSSATILTKFDALLDSLEGSFQTNMDYTKMLEIVRMQISDNATWNISSISIDGLGSTERTYSMGKTLLYVMIPYAGSVNKAESMIKSVLNGEMLEEGSIDLSSYNDYPVVQRGTYPTENKDKDDKKEEVKKEENKVEDPEEPTVENPNDNETTEGNTGDTDLNGGTTGDNGAAGDNAGDAGSNGGTTEDGGSTGDSTGDAGSNSGTTEDGDSTGDNTGDTGSNSGTTENGGSTGDSTENTDSNSGTSGESTTNTDSNS